MTNVSPAKKTTLTRLTPKHETARDLTFTALQFDGSPASARQIAVLLARHLNGFKRDAIPDPDNKKDGAEIEESAVLELSSIEGTRHTVRIGDWVLLWPIAFRARGFLVATDDTVKAHYTAARA